MNNLVDYTTRDGVAVITINNPPVNALCPGVPEGIAEGVRLASDDDAVNAIVLIGGGSTFSTGEDTEEIGKITSRGKSLHPMLFGLENASMPIVCAIHGSALSSGLEIGLACHYRVAAPSAKVGFPEMALGLIPAAGGTQRLPRLIGIAAAAEMVGLGRAISASDALNRGLIDSVIEGDLLDGAIAFAQSIASAPGRKTSELADKLTNSNDNREALDKLKGLVARKFRGVPAGSKAVELVEAAASATFIEGIKNEANAFVDCLQSDQSKGMIHIYQSTRIADQVPGITKDTPVKEIRTAAVIGGGLMGGGIAMNYANAGIPVTVKETEKERLDYGIGQIRNNYDISAKRGRFTEKQVEERMALITPTTSYDDIGEADIVVEAVFENLDLKLQVFGEIDAAAKADAILASNTSTLDIDKIAGATSRPSQVIGHHFFSPANVMKLIEIVRGKESSNEVIATSLALAKRLRKVGVVVGNCFAFLGNRMFGLYIRESKFLVEEGAKVQDVDKALFDWGMAMGPIAVLDMSGVDVDWRIHDSIRDTLPEGMRRMLLTDPIYEMGRYGLKTGKGYYRYESGSRKPIPDPEVEKMIEEVTSTAGIEQRKIETEEIIERTLYALINEGAFILEEGIALRSGDIDVVFINGYGFPARRGGPMFFADTVGLKNVYDRVCQFEQEQGFWWKPAPLLKKLAEEGKSFGEYDREQAEA